MLLLGIDTAATTSVAVAQTGSDEITVLAEKTTTSTTDHVEQLTPTVQELLATAGYTLNQLDGLVVGVGPGPFTGLRVGMVAASSYGFALDIPIYGVMSLDAIALAAAETLEPGTEFVVAADARRREIYYAHYRAGVQHQNPDLLTGPGVIKAAEMVTALSSLPAWGPGVALYPEAFGDQRQLTSHHGLDQELDQELEQGPAAYLIQRVANSLRIGETLLPLEPLYLRESDAKVPTQNWARNVR